jgi:hypothetical protein
MRRAAISSQTVTGQEYEQGLLDGEFSQSDPTVCLSTISVTVSVNRLLVSELALKLSRHCQVEQVTKTSLADTHRFQVSPCDEVVHHDRSVRSVRLLRNYSYEWLGTQL